jgi:hypothetical protein
MVHPLNLADAPFRYMDAEAFVARRKAYQVELVGPRAKNCWWQARTQNGYDASQFLH